MSLSKFHATGFRCLGDVTFSPDPHFNLISGPNASGKTSLLEAIFYLGRGRSFRSSGNRELIQSGVSRFQLFGESTGLNGHHRSGIEVRHGAREVRVDGNAGTGADLARLLPVQAIDPEIHELIQGAPDNRRRFLDWGVFHVKHSFLDHWRRYQKALQQRNAALRMGESEQSVRLWDTELAQAGEAVDTDRQAFLDGFLPLFSSIVLEKLPFDAICSYKRGFSPTESLLEALDSHWDRDRQMGSTQVGPHRADLAIAVQDRRARHRVSRGQQKLLAAALVIAQSRYVASVAKEDMILLVDDPAAELDRDNREVLFELLREVPAQLFVTALEPDDLPWKGQGSAHRIEHGELLSLL